MTNKYKTNEKRRDMVKRLTLKMYTKIIEINKIKIVEKDVHIKNQGGKYK